MFASASCEVIAVIMVLMGQIGRSLGPSRYRRIRSKHFVPSTSSTFMAAVGTVAERIRRFVHRVDWRVPKRSLIIGGLGLMYCMPILSFFAYFDLIPVGATVAKWYAPAGTALLFGVVFQLLWEEKPLTEPL